MAQRGKTLKAVSSRLTITKRGKVMRRTAQQSHFKAKDTGKIRRQKRKMIGSGKNPYVQRSLMRYLPHHPHVR